MIILRDKYFARRDYMIDKGTKMTEEQAKHLGAKRSEIAKKLLQQRKEIKEAGFNQSDTRSLQKGYLGDARKEAAKARGEIVKEHFADRTKSNQVKKELPRSNAPTPENTKLGNAGKANSNPTPTPENTKLGDAKATSAGKGTGTGVVTKNTPKAKAGYFDRGINYVQRTWRKSGKLGKAGMIAAPIAAGAVAGGMIGSRNRK